jgi:hypothetical protein
VSRKKVMQPKFESHKPVRITAGRQDLKVKVKDYGGNESTKDLRQFTGLAGKIRHQVVGPSVEWQIPQWFYDIETEDGSRVYQIPEASLEALA